MRTQVVTYQVDESTKVMFEVEPAEGFRPASVGQIAGRVRDAIAPAVDAARVVLERVKEVRPDEVEVRFGVKVSGGADWFVAKSAGEASFEIKLIWKANADPGNAITPETVPNDAAVSDGVPTRPGTSGADGE